MTAPRTWKKHEDYWAKLHGETRSGPTGRDEPDATMDNCLLAIECKFQSRRTLRTTDIAQAQENAAKHECPWILVLHENGTERRDDLVVMDHDTYLLLKAGFYRFTATSPTSTKATIAAMHRYPKVTGAADE